MYYIDGNPLATIKAHSLSPSAPPLPLPLEPVDCQPSSSHMYYENLISPTSGSVTPGASSDFSLPDDEQPVSDEINSRNSFIGQPYSGLRSSTGDNTNKIES